MPVDQLLDLAAASLACALGVVATHPLETLKVRQMVAPPFADGRAPGTLRVLGAIARDEGLGVLWAGLGAGLARAVVQGGVRLALYERGKDELARRAPASANRRGRGLVDTDGGRVLVGTGAGGAAALIGAPIDTVRTVQQAAAAQGGALAVSARLVRRDGVLSLWTGSGTAVARCAVMTAAQCATYDRAKAAASEALGWPPTAVRTHVVAALASGVATATATAPFDNVKTTQIVARSGALQAARAVWRAGGGPAGFLRGWGSIYLRIAPHTVIMFASLEAMRAGLARRPGRAARQLIS
jgi:solute carrier family 25 uncoupling protein 8/9